MVTQSIWHVIASWALIATTLCGAETEKAFYVGPSGLDTNPGTVDAPFATLPRARDAVRQWRQTTGQQSGLVTVNLRRGRYRVTDTLTLTEKDSGTQESSVIWQAAPGEEVRLVGGIPLTDWKRVAAPKILERLAPEARGKVLQVDLGANGVDDYGTVKPGLTRAELFFNNRYMTLVRYPNEGWERIAAVPDGAATKRPIGDPGRPDLNRYEGPFLYSGNRPARWSKSNDIWVHGYWFHDWSDQYHQVMKLDSATKAVWPTPPYHSYGYKAGQRYYFLNILEELDQPGEWYLDRNSGRGMTIENNIFVQSRNGIRFNVWMDLKKFQEGGNWRMVERLREVDYDKPPYSTRYPALARLAADFAKGDEGLLQRALPKDNIIRRNVSWGDGYFLCLGPQADFSHVRVEQNLICDPIVFVGSPTGDGISRTFNNGDEEIRAVLEESGNVIISGSPGLTDPEAGDFRLKDDSPAWKLGFESIPFKEIGLYVDLFRTTLPVRISSTVSEHPSGSRCLARWWMSIQ